MEVNQVLENLRGGNVYDAFEAAKSLSRLPRLPAERIVEVLAAAEGVHNREAAAYALSWLRQKDRNKTLRALLNITDDESEHPAVRAQALEGLGVQRPTQRHKLWAEVERAVLGGLRNESVEVRFWACYAAGTLRLKSALPLLAEMARSDSAVYPRWWRVSEEAADAIEWIHGRETEARSPVPDSPKGRGEA
jgi:HEAT repeat protein